jgi:replicative DNA helicase
LAQLNRSATKKDREANRPCLSDVRESGSIEEDADGCILLHRPEYYKEGDKPGMVEVIVAKNRLRGIVKTIPFVCKSIFCERYHEASELEIEEWKQDAEEKKKKNARWEQNDD